ncbi:cytochrome c biogenesis heme-transporting ATPase CcmA [Aliikangiella marina]|uniref:Cytochrome c biogenesis heme-transporting ATPase CcmA n=1 Tax=Aliikangiella marina TaxID=1712262 RepID=A0A545T2L3_9GAMM|nr:cytochrome c biogenesis heme-transporting ATPase CcmA [Aliikangiella marina]TQV71425.1 cytochrome c biogenesis heme-transporting ATPase CcmA [Aliikangiella marina]
MAVYNADHKSKNTIKISDLTVSRGDIPIFDPVNLQLSSGDSIQIRGVNGAGKTTLLRAICGLCNSHEGIVEWNERSIFDHESDFYENLLYLGHSLGLKPKLTAEQNLNFYRNLRFSTDKSLVRQALEQTGIGGYYDEFVARMSAGQKRRVALARVITEPVPLWILDEPMVALDIHGQAWLEQVCNNHLERGGILLVTSHQPISGINGLRELQLT